MLMWYCRESSERPPGFRTETGSVDLGVSGLADSCFFASVVGGESGTFATLKSAYSQRALKVLAIRAIRLSFFVPF